MSLFNWTSGWADVPELRDENKAKCQQLLLWEFLSKFFQVMSQGGHHLNSNFLPHLKLK